MRKIMSGVVLLLLLGTMLSSAALAVRTDVYRPPLPEEVCAHESSTLIVDLSSAPECNVKDKGKLGDESGVITDGPDPVDQ